MTPLSRIDGQRRVAGRQQPGNARGLAVRVMCRRSSPGCARPFERTCAPAARTFLNSSRINAIRRTRQPGGCRRSIGDRVGTRVLIQQHVAVVSRPLTRVIDDEHTSTRRLQPRGTRRETVSVNRHPRPAVTPHPCCNRDPNRPADARSMPSDAASRGQRTGQQRRHRRCRTSRRSRRRAATHRQAPDCASRDRRRHRRRHRRESRAAARSSCGTRGRRAHGFDDIIHIVDRSFPARAAA